MTRSLRLANSLGCSIAGTAVIHAMVEKYGAKNVRVTTKFPSLLEGIDHIIVDLAQDDHDEVFDVDLREYTARRPHNLAPYRSSYVHMLEMAESQMATSLPHRQPKLFLSQKELMWAKAEVAELGGTVIWLQTRTTSSTRDWPEKNWREVIDALSASCAFLDLGNANYSLRESLALTTACAGGVCLDSFLIHGSAAVGASGVLALLGSSRIECVSYPGQVVLFSPQTCYAQPCGMHGYHRGCSPVFDDEFSKRDCVHSKIICMEAIPPAEVISRLQELLHANCLPVATSQ